MTKKEFMISQKAFEKGVICAYKGILNHCKACIKAHRKEGTKRRIQQITEMNKHLWRLKDE